LLLDDQEAFVREDDALDAAVFVAAKTMNRVGRARTDSYSPRVALTLTDSYSSFFRSIS
jgi:hypothetical protein